MAQLRGVPDLHHDRRRPPRSPCPTGSRRSTWRPSPKPSPSRTRVVFVTSPNNPTGTVVRPRRARRAARRRARPSASSCWTRRTTSTSPAATHPTRWRSWPSGPTSPCCAPSRRPTAWRRCASATCSAHPDVVSAIDQVLVPFAVNGLGQAAALASLDGRRRAGGAGDRRGDRARARRRRAAPARRAVRARSSGQLRVAAGRRPGAADLTVALERAGLVTRPFPGEGVRITIGTAADDDRVLDAIERLWPVRSVWPTRGCCRSATVPSASRRSAIVERIDAIDGGTGRGRPPRRHAPVARPCARTSPGCRRPTGPVSAPCRRGT